MPIRPPLLAALVLFAGSVPAAWANDPLGGVGGMEPESATHFETHVRPVLENYCGDCHHPDDPENHVRFLDAAAAGDLHDDRGLWSNVAEQLRNRTMPPADAEAPGEADRKAVADWVETFLRDTACERGPYLGPVVARRLNRQEYDNTIRDLLGVDVKPASSFPADGAGGEGFDNNGETLFLPPILMERYLTAAGLALDAAIWTPRLKAGWTAAELLPPAPGDRGPRVLAPGTELSAALPIYLAGDVTVNVKARPVGDSADPAAAAVVLTVDGVRAGRLTFDDAGGVPPRARTTVRLRRGTHVLSVSNPTGMSLAVEAVEVWDDRRDAPPKAVAAAHEALLGVPPGVVPDDDPRGAAAEALARFARRAYRRPLREGERDRLLVLYDRAADRGDPWEERFKLAARAALVSPHFLFRTEPPVQSGGETGGDEPEYVGDHALASRLSYFLWASMPDAELFELADAGRLSDPGVLDAQVDRMLADPKARGFAEAFAGQWLGTREVGGRIAPDANRFRPLFSSELLDDLRNQPAELWLYLVREDRPLSELVTADYAILNERLTYHYGLAKPPERLRKPASKTRDSGQKWLHDEDLDSTFRRFDLKGEEADRRGGVLGLGGAMLANSYAERTSPVLRGAWVLETLLGVRVPPPPPDVPELRVGKTEAKTVREKLARHRDDPACAACHNLMDPVGFSLDNFDIVGRWRTDERGAKIDASASLPTGESFVGPGGLKRVLAQREDRVTRHLTAKLLGYALGRSLEDGDDCTVDRIARRVEQRGGTARELVQAVAASDPFRLVARGAAAP